MFDFSIFLVVNFWGHLPLLDADDHRLPEYFSMVLFIMGWL